MTPQILYEELIKFCESHADEAIVRKYSRYFKEGYDSYGVSSELFQSKVEELAKDKSITLALILDSAPMLLGNGKYELASFAIMLTLKKKKEFTASTFDRVEKWFSFGINNWAHTDIISGELLAFYFIKKNVPLERLSAWRTSELKFQRRAVPVTLIKQLKTTSDFEPLFDFINPMMEDKERVVHQGLGWFLREAWKKQPEKTECFLLQWKDLSARLIFQYATEKMSKEQRLRFKKEK